MEKRTLVQAKELVNSSFPTIFSKEDVMNLLNSIEETEVKQTEGKDFLSLSDSEISVLAERIASKIEDEVDDVVDTSDLDFDIDVDYDRRINIEVSGGVQIDTSLIERITSDIIEEFIVELNEKDDEE
jgi:frataxin-like iron-binding protein CyaY